VALNRAVALAEVEGPGAALALLDGLGPRWLSPFSILIRADLLRRMGWTAEARGRPRAGPSTSRNRILNGAERRLTELLAPISGKE
jgi:RNA polymerase sigma-70 factor (ECF subfamily)